MAGPLGSTPGIIVGVGVGTAASVALEPTVELPRQKVWADNPNRLLDPQLLARLVAQGGVNLEVGRADAKREGFTSEKFDQLVYLSQTVPPVAEAVTLWRKALIPDALFYHSLTKAGLDARYLGPLAGLKMDERLAPSQIALGIVRSILDDAGLLVTKLDTGPGKVPRYPVSPLDPVAEAATWGITKERLRVMVGEIGLPMSPQQAASALFRGIIERTDYNAAIAEGDIRPEWAAAILAQARQILTANQYAELQLRGYIDRDRRLDKTSQTGMSEADSDLLYNLLGRSIPVHQITTGLARGGTFDGPTETIPRAYLQSLERGNLRPEYYSLAYANRYTMPSAFVIRGLVQSGAWTEQRGRQALEFSGWIPEWAADTAAQWAEGAGGGGDPHVDKAQTQLWNTTHRSYVAGETDAQAAAASLAAAGVAAAFVPKVLALWEHERELVRRQLTPAQIKKAYVNGVENRATGLPWTREDAVAALIGLGYAVATAEEFLDLPSR